MTNKQKALLTIGNSMVSCNLQCHGISNNLTAGHVPRCLALENSTDKVLLMDTDFRADDEECGAIVVGLNPGKASADEIAAYIKCSTTLGCDLYAETVRQMPLKEHEYYNRLRCLVRSAKLTGPILWTELVKCQSLNKSLTSALPQTTRICSQQYLATEVALFPDWPIICAGRESFNACAHLFPIRAVVGVCHPTGAKINYQKYLSGKTFWSEIQMAMKYKNAVWIPS